MPGRGVRRGLLYLLSCGIVVVVVVIGFRGSCVLYPHSHSQLFDVCMLSFQRTAGNGLGTRLEVGVLYNIVKLTIIEFSSGQ